MKVLLFAMVLYSVYFAGECSKNVPLDDSIRLPISPSQYYPPEE